MTNAIRRVLVTGGAGFIGSAVCRHLIAKGYEVVNLDKLTYAANFPSLHSLASNPSYGFYQVDIGDERRVLDVLRETRVHAIMHLAAESHVDRSIRDPGDFIQSNVVGTFRLLSAALRYWRELDPEAQRFFRFHHISTDEVFGDLPFDRGKFTEKTRYDPSSPYAASKAASDHFVRAWHKSYGLPVVLSNCSNNYGPYHFPEKFIPLIICNAIEHMPLPIYGRGDNVRDWLFVTDHAQALELVLTRGGVGESYNIGGRAERTNLQVVEAICSLLDRKRPVPGRSYRSLIRFVSDRPAHDRRYAVDPSKAEQELGWVAQESFETGLEKTVDWFLANECWWRPIRYNETGTDLDQP